MQPRMLFFEGPPGAGKSSLSQFIAQQLHAGAVPTIWLEEHTLIDSTFAPFLQALESGVPEPVATLTACWQSLLDAVHGTDAVYCLDGAYFHSTLKLLFAYRCNPSQIARYLEWLHGALAPFAPPLVHLTGDVAQIVTQVAAERGDRWVTAVTSQIARYPCHQQMSGRDALVRFFADSQRELEAIAATYPYACHRIDTAARQWERYQLELCQLLDVRMQLERPHQLSNTMDYVGVYRTPAGFPPEFNRPFEVESTSEGLRLHMAFMRNFRLVAQGMDRFAIAGRPLVLEFVRDAAGEVVGAIYPFVPDRRFVCAKVCGEQ